GRKRSHRVGVPIGRNGDEDFRRPDINTARLGSHYRQTPVQLSMFPFLCLCHGSPPLVRQRARRARMGNLLRGIIATQTACCASPMLLCTGLGSNSLTGSPKQAPMGTRSTLTVAVSDVLEHVGDKAGPDPLHEFVFSLFMGMTHEKFLAVIGLAAGQLEILLGKGGVAAPSRKMVPFLSKARTGWFVQLPIIGGWNEPLLLDGCALSGLRGLSPPSAPAKEAPHHFLDGR